MPEARVRFLTTGQVKKTSTSKGSAPKTVDQKVEDLKAKLDVANKEKYDLKKEIKRLKDVIRNLNYLDK